MPSRVRRSTRTRLVFPTNRFPILPRRVSRPSYPTAYYTHLHFRGFVARMADCRSSSQTRQDRSRALDYQRANSFPLLWLFLGLQPLDVNACGNQTLGGWLRRRSRPATSLWTDKQKDRKQRKYPIPSIGHFRDERQRRGPLSHHSRRLVGRCGREWKPLGTLRGIDVFGGFCMVMGVS